MIGMLKFNKFEIKGWFEHISDDKEELKIVLQKWKGHFAP